MDTSHAIDTTSRSSHYFAPARYTGKASRTPEQVNHAANDLVRQKYEFLDTEGRPATCLVWF